MKPDGTPKPLVYILGEAPGEDEDRKGTPFVGRAGKVLHFRIPDNWLDDIRFNNVVRTRPPKNREPTPVEIECCRASISADIEETKPRAIFGMGNIPLYWIMKQRGILQWRGRRLPVKIGSHTCWYYPMLHPSFVLRRRRRNKYGEPFVPRSLDEYGSDDEFAFALDLKRAFAEVELLPEPIVHTREDAVANIECINGENGSKDLDRVFDFIESMYDEKVVGLDYETPFLRPYEKDAKILTVGLAGSKDRNLAFALHHPGAMWSKRELDVIEEAFEEFLHKAPCRKISFALPFEMEWSGYFYGKECLHGSKWGDAQAQAYVLDGVRGAGDDDEKRAPGLSLEFLCWQYFGFDLKALSNVDRKNLIKTSVDQVMLYNGLDAKYHRLLWFEQAARLDTEKQWTEYNYLVQRMPATVHSQLNGVPVDQKVVAQNVVKYGDRLKEFEADLLAHPAVKKFKAQTGKTFRPSATKDVGYLFSKILGIELESNKASELEKTKHPVGKLILKWRKCAKTFSTYVLPLSEDSEESVVYPDGLLHPTYSLTKTRTTRTSCDDPNAQNFPKRDPETKAEIRKQVKHKFKKIVSFDYAQIQARNVAMESLDKRLIKAFWERYDIHTDWMEKVIELYPAWIKEGLKKFRAEPKLRKTYRDKAKNEIVFPSFFGAQPPKLSRSLGVPIEVTEQLHEEFWDMFPDVKAWHKVLDKSYHKLGYVTGLSGFRRYAPVSRNELVNSPIQADETIIVLDAMARLSKISDDPRFQTMLEVHDDLTFLWEKHEIEKNAEVVISHMVDVPFEWAKCVPIVIEMAVGDDWGSTEDVGMFGSDDWTGKLTEKQMDVIDPYSGNWSDGTGWDNEPNRERDHYRPKDPR